MLTQTAFKECNDWFDLDKGLVDKIKTLIGDIDKIHLKALVGRNLCVATSGVTGAGELITNIGLSTK